MRKYYPGPKGQKKAYDPDDAFLLMKTWLPKKTAAIIKEKHLETGVAMSRLIAIAVDNELDSTMPFHYPWPSSFPGEYVEYAYAEQAGKLLKFLERFPTGTQRESILLCRRDIGIETREEIIQAYRELIAQDLIQEFRTPHSQSIYVRVVGLTREQIKKKKYKSVEGESTKYKRPITDEDVE